MPEGLPNLARMNGVTNERGPTRIALAHHEVKGHIQEIMPPKFGVYQVFHIMPDGRRFEVAQFWGDGTHEVVQHGYPFVKFMEECEKLVQVHFVLDS